MVIQLFHKCQDVRDILVDLGYKIQDHGREFRMLLFIETQAIVLC